MARARSPRQPCLQRPDGPAAFSGTEGERVPGIGQSAPETRQGFLVEGVLEGVRGQGSGSLLRLVLSALGSGCLLSHPGSHGCSHGWRTVPWGWRRHRLAGERLPRRRAGTRGTEPVAPGDPSSCLHPTAWLGLLGCRPLRGLSRPWLCGSLTGGALRGGQDREDWSRPPGSELRPPLPTCPRGGPQALFPRANRGSVIVFEE